MACIVYQTDKKTGAKYAYESVSYWDADKQQPRSKRKYLGRVNPETGEIIAKKAKKKDSPAASGDVPQASAETASPSLLTEKEKEISALKKENAALRRENQSILASLKKILEGHPAD